MTSTVLTSWGLIILTMIQENFSIYTELKYLLKKENDGMGNVYIIKAGEFYKIGRTYKTIQDRIKALQTGCPYKIEPIAFYRGEHYKLLEIQLHIILRENGFESFNEWYKNENLEYFIEFLISKLNFKRV